jgi:O-antigen ligase
MSAITLFFGGLLGMASWLVPNHYLPWLSFHAEFLMGTAGVLALTGELTLNRLAQHALPPLTVATLLVACVPLVQAATGLILFAGDAWMVFEYLLAFALAQVLGQMLTHRIGADVLFETVSALFLAASLACVGLQLIQWLRLPGLGIFSIELAPLHAPYANVAQPNHLASMLFLGVVGLFFLHERGRVRGALAVATYGLLAFGMVMTASRTAWLTMGLAAVGLWLACGRAPLRIGRARVIGAALGFLFLLLTWTPLNDLLLLSPGRTFAVQSQLGPRPLLWATMAIAISLQPWFGYGWNQGLVAQSRVVDQFPASGRLIQNSHNLMLDLAVWNGVPLALALCALLGWWFWKHLRASRSAAQVGLLTGVGAVFVHAMLEFPLSYAYFLVPVGLMMGALDAAAPSRTRSRLTKPAAWALVAVAGGLLVAIAAEYVEVETNTRTLQLELARVGTHKVVSPAPDLALLTQWDAYLRFARIEPKPGMLPGELDWMGKVVERFPYAHAQFNVAAANALNGRPDDARQMLARMCHLHTRQNCLQQLREWRDLALAYPQLAAVALPP